MPHHIICLAFLTMLACQKQNDVPTSLRLSLKVVDGYGSFYAAHSPLGNDHKGDEEALAYWGKMYMNVRGGPAHWSSVDKAMVWLDAHQLVYQTYKAGVFPKRQFDELKENWKIDTTVLFPKPIRCYVYTLRGFDNRAGKWMAMVDTDNDLDFSDETPFEPEILNSKTAYTPSKVLRWVNYDRVVGGRIKSERIPMDIKTMGEEFLYSFPQHVVATPTINGKQYKLAIDRGFTGPSYESPTLIDITGKPANFKEGVGIVRDEVVKLGDYSFIHKGVDAVTEQLQLERIKSHSVLYSLQVGHLFKPFSAIEFSTGKPIALADFKGKHVYVEFWGTWCKGCVEEVPALKQAYQKMDKSKFAMIGIATEDSPEKLRAFLDRRGVQWPQILSDKQNKLIENYPVKGFPTSVLLDKNGVVIAKNLRGNELLTKINELSKR